MRERTIYERYRDLEDRKAQAGILDHSLVNLVHGGMKVEEAMRQIVERDCCVELTPMRAPEMTS